MTAALVCSILMIYTSIEVFTIPAPPSQSYDALLDEVIAAENDRRTAMKKAEKEAENKKSDAMGKFLETVKKVDEALVNMRLYFDAGKTVFDVNEGKLNAQQADVDASTPVPQSESYDELLHELTEAEINRRAVIVKVADEAERKKSSAMNKFMQTVAEADEALVNIRLYFDAENVPPKS
nr:PREDICTED: uncharacterized protein LOC109040398 isoform X2 [Bemisia tabaci]